MKIALAQLNYHIGNFEKNSHKIISIIQQAKQNKADLVLFSELSVCGYPPQDLLEHIDFIEKCTDAIKNIALECTGIAAIIGGPSINQNKKGKSLFNSAYFLSNGIIEKVIHKTLLPTYDIFDEYRYFESNTDFNLIEYKNKKIALTICEDLWDEQPFQTPLGRSNLYSVTPIDQLIKQKPDFIVNIAASPFAYTRIQTKRSIFTAKAKKYQLPLFYINQVGANTELIFEGNSMAINSKGLIVNELKAFTEDCCYVELDELEQKSETKLREINETEEIYEALVLGIRDFFEKMNFKKATLGLSGGIDSAVTLVLAARAIGAENIKVLLMPSKYSSDHSITDSLELAKNLTIQYHILSIQELANQYKESLNPVFNGLPEDVTEENIQARIRGNLLMALSNKFGHILLNTSNKSEAAVGYGTLYGDMAGGLSVLGDVYKTVVYKLANYINKDRIIIPQNIITKPPSAELRPDQKDSDSLPEYDVLDMILYKYIELQLPEKEIIKEGFSEQIVKKVIRLINSNEYKRYQSPPMLRVTSKAFGIGRRMPLVAKF